VDDELSSCCPADGAGDFDPKSIIASTTVDTPKSAVVTASPTSRDERESSLDDDVEAVSSLFALASAVDRYLFAHEE
jgi:hypothetical protein